MHVTFYACSMHVTCMENVRNPCMLHETCMYINIITCMFCCSCYLMKFAWNMHVTCTLFPVDLGDFNIFEYKLRTMEVVSNSSYSVIQESDNEKQPSVEAMGFTRLNLAANCATHCKVYFN